MMTDEMPSDWEWARQVLAVLADDIRWLKAVVAEMREERVEFRKMWDESLQMWRENNRRWEENNRRWHENDRKWWAAHKILVHLAQGDGGPVPDA